MFAAGPYSLNKNLELDTSPVSGGSYISETDPSSIAGRIWCGWRGGSADLAQSYRAYSPGSPGFQPLGNGRNLAKWKILMK